MNLTERAVMKGSVLLLANFNQPTNQPTKFHSNIHCNLAAAPVLTCCAAAAGISSVCGSFLQLPGPVSCRKGRLSGLVTHQA
jgi:hypothetical protein